VGRVRVGVRGVSARQGGLMDVSQR
jgi:hypothetical protein